MQKISTCIWFDKNAEEAANFYVQTFPNSKINTTTRYGEAGDHIPGRPGKGTVMTVALTIDGSDFLALNGGPQFKINPAISFMICCETADEVERLYNALSAGGNVLMPLAQYPFSEKYGWVNDKFGVSWQINLRPGRQKIGPALMFNGDRFGQAEEALNFYVSQFPDSKVESIFHREEDGRQSVLHATFELCGQQFMAMDSPINHQFGFEPAVSFMIQCETQQEIDKYWNSLSAGGQTVQCGWLTDKFGVSWQVVPSVLSNLMHAGNNAKREAVTDALLKMTKLDIAQLQAAYDKA